MAKKDIEEDKEFEEFFQKTLGSVNSANTLSSSVRKSSIMDDEVTDRNSNETNPFEDNSTN